MGGMTMAEEQGKKNTLFHRSFNDSHTIDDWKDYSTDVATIGTCINLGDEPYDDWSWSNKLYVADVRVSETRVRRATDDESGHARWSYMEVQEPHYEYICLVNSSEHGGQYLVFDERSMRNLHEHGFLEFPTDPIAWLGLRDGPRLVAG